MKTEIIQRKNLRIPNYNYSNKGLYFITIYTQNRECILSKIIYNRHLEFTKLELLRTGQIVEKYIKSINDTYKDIQIKNYVIMPNHIHLICEVLNNNTCKVTKTNEKIPFIISTLKRLSNKEIGKKIWQRNYFEHIIRNEKDYFNIVKYIENNPRKWKEDK